MDLRRALETTRRIVSAAGRGQEPPALAYVEAATLAPSSEQRARAVADAAARVARAADPVAAAREIAAGFLRPAVAPRRSATHEPAAAVSVAFSSMRRGLESPAPDAHEMREAVRVLGDAMRELGDQVEAEDMILAADVLAEATLRSAALASFAKDTAAELRRRHDSSRNTLERDTMRRAAARLSVAHTRAGTIGTRRTPDPAASLLEDAVARGADVDEANAVARFCREFDELSSSSSIPSMSRERYVDILLARWRLNRSDPHRTR